MKKITFILGLALLFPVLSGCGEGNDANQKYKVTFHQENATDVSVEFDKTTKQSEVEINEPNLIAKEGYIVKWEDYSIVGKTSSFTVNAVYTPIVYHANFMSLGSLVQSVEFTVDDVKGEHPQIPSYKTPAVPEYSWADGHWEDYTLTLNDMEIKAIYDELRTFTLKFVAQGFQLGPTITYTKNDIDAEGKIRRDLIPQEVFDYKLEYHDISWDFTIPEGRDIVIQPNIDLHPFYLSFLDFDGEQIGEKVPYYYNSTWESIEKPDAPEVTGYDTFWPKNVVLSKLDETQIVNPLKTGKHYTITFEGFEGSQEVVFGEEYVLDHSSSISNKWSVGDIIIGDSGIWNYPNNALLTKKRVLKENFDGGVPSYISLDKSVNVKSIENVSGLGMNDSNAIKVVIDKSQNFGIHFEKEALDEVFLDPSVNLINIIARSNIQNNNFRHRTNGVNVCYETNSAGFGIDLNYKTFSFTREMYEDYVDGDFMIYGGQGDAKGQPISCAGEEIYIDSLIFGGRNSIGYDNDSFEDGHFDVIAADSTNNECNFYHTYDTEKLNSSFYKVRYSTSAVNMMKPKYDYDHVTDGIRSMAFEKSAGYVAIYLSSLFLEELKASASKKFTFDFWSECSIHSDDQVLNLQDGIGGVGHTFGELQPEKQFKTYELQFVFAGESKDADRTLSQVSTDGRFLIMQGSTIGTFCFDNFRIVK